VRPIDILAPTAVGALLFGLSMAVGPTIGVGVFLGLALLGVIFIYPIVGLGLMLLTGTALQVLGSEHLTGLPLSLGKIAGILTLLAWIARSLIDRTALTYSPQLPALASFALILTLVTFAASDQALARDGLFRYAQLFLLFFMIANIAGQSRQALSGACLLLTACMTVSAIIGFLEFFVPSLAIESDDPSLVEGAIGAIIDRDSIEGTPIKRITGGLSDSNWLGYTLVAVLPFNLYLWHHYRAPLIRAFILVATGLQSICIVLSYTRSAILALGVTVIVLTVKRRLPFALVIGAAFVGSLVFIIWNPPGLQRVFSTEYLKGGSTPMREYLLRGGVALILQRPLMGYGYSQFGPAFHNWLGRQPIEESIADWEKHLETRVDAGEDKFEWVMPHNTILQVWVEFGVFGFLAFALFLAFSLHDLRVAKRFGSKQECLLADCLLASTLGLFVCMIFGHLALVKIIWTLPGLAAALRRITLSSNDGAPVPATRALTVG